MDCLQIMCNTLVEKYAKLSEFVHDDGNIKPMESEQRTE